MSSGTMRFQRYQAYPMVEIPDRTWPDRSLTKAPAWCSVDLRDGNQALPVPMSVEEKCELFKLLVAIGFKEIEVAFPAAAQIEFNFVRTLIEAHLIPDDVTIQVLTQARDPLIRRTFEALKDVKQAIVHVYNSTSTTQRRVVFGMDTPGITKIAVDAAVLMADLKNDLPGSTIRFQYTPESFTGTEPEYALDICHAVMDVWRPSADKPVILNLPATVEMSTPNIYADRIEWFLRHVRNRESVIVSVHPHNDRGTAVAAAELAVMAGAQRVEGALFGNGERTGNMDILTMAMNLFSRGVDPELDFSDIDRIREIHVRCTRMAVHARHPYAGDLVYTAFSGSHQDAISKGMKAQGSSLERMWDVPYLPIDPRDVGRSYESIIRINSQSGKGGVAYVLEQEAGFHIPRKMQPDVARVVQEQTEIAGRELAPRDVLRCFREAYLSGAGPYRLASCTIHTADGGNDDRGETTIQAVLRKGTRDMAIRAGGKGPLEAFIRGLGESLRTPFDVTLYEEHALKEGADAEAVAYIGMTDGYGRVAFGVGIDANISVASIKAVVSALNRLP